MAPPSKHCESFHFASNKCIYIYAHMFKYTQSIFFPQHSPKWWDVRVSKEADSNTQRHPNKIRTNPLTQNRSKHCLQLRSPQSSPAEPHEVLAGVLTSASAPQSPKPTQVFEQQVAVVQLPPARVLQGTEARFGSGVTPSPLHTSDEEAQVGTQQTSGVP